MEKITAKPTGCCEPFDPALWEDKRTTWNDKIFVKDHITSFLHIPLNISGKIGKNMKLIEKAKAKSHHQLMLFDEKSLWGCDVYIDVTREVPGAIMYALSGTFMTKVFEGHFQNVGKWAKEMEKYVTSKGETIKKLYFFYTTCPKCAKSYGKNYVVLFAQV